MARLQAAVAAHDRHSRQLDQLLGDPVRGIRADGPRERRIRLVGRDREMSAVQDILDDNLAGASRWLLLTGPPGIGKTRLAEEAAGNATTIGAQAIWVVCPDERGTPPW